MSSKEQGTTAKTVPPNAGKGRKKGVQNKMTRELKQMILDALDEAGGVAYLVDRARDPRTASSFISLLGKVLPLQVTGKDGAPLIPNRKLTDYTDDELAAIIASGRA